MAEGVGFEPTIGETPDKRLAGARTRPLCDPSGEAPIVGGVDLRDKGLRSKAIFMGIGAEPLALSGRNGIE